MGNLPLKLDYATSAKVAERVRLALGETVERLLSTCLFAYPGADPGEMRLEIFLAGSRYWATHVDPHEMPLCEREAVPEAVEDPGPDFVAEGTPAPDDGANGANGEHGR